MAVLDFDDSWKASEFRRLHPHLTETLVVQSGTRALPHYYYHIPDSLSVYSRSVPGVDFRVDGTYVVAPPTQVGDAEWRVIHDRSLYNLSVADLKAILRFMAGIGLQTLENGSDDPSGVILGHLGRGFSIPGRSESTGCQGSRAPVGCFG